MEAADGLEQLIKKNAQTKTSPRRESGDVFLISIELLLRGLLRLNRSRLPHQHRAEETIGVVLGRG